MNTIFKINYRKIIKKNIFFTEEIYDYLGEIFNYNKEENTEFLLSKLEESWFEKSKIVSIKFICLLEFIKYLWEKQNFSDINISEFLKKEISLYIDNKENFSKILESLFEIEEYQNKKYYIDLYEYSRVQKLIKHSLNRVFLEIFIKWKYNKLFIETFKALIFDLSLDVLNYSIREWLILGLKYILSYKKTRFIKNMSNILDIFSDFKNKKKCFGSNTYYSIIPNYGSDNDIEELINSILKKIEEYKDKSLLEKLFSFWESEIEFTCKNYVFDDLSFLIFFKKLTIFFLNNNYKEKVINLIKLYINNNHTKSNMLNSEFFLIYYKYIWLEKIINILWNENIYYLDRLCEDIKKISKDYSELEICEKNPDLIKYKKERKKKLEEIKVNKENKNNLICENWVDFIIKYRELENSRLLKKLVTKYGLSKINKKLKKEIESFLENNNFIEYNENMYKQNDYMWFIISACLTLWNKFKIDFSKYQKIIILNHISYWDEARKIFFKNIKNLDKKDKIFFIENFPKIWDKNYKFIINNYTHSLDNYKRYFTKKQTKIVREKCIYNLKESNNVYLLELLIQFWKKNDLKYLEKFYEKYLPKDFNYFDFLKNYEYEESNFREKIDFLIFIKTKLILNFWERKAFNFLFNQVKNWKIEFEDEFDDPNRRSIMILQGKRIRDEIWTYWTRKWNIKLLFEEMPKTWKNIITSKDIIILFKQSLKIIWDINKGNISKSYYNYMKYLQELSFIYLENIQKNKLDKNIYTSIIKSLKKYPENTRLEFDIDKLKKIFNVSDLEEEAIELKNSDINKIKEFIKVRDELQQRYYESKIEIDKLKTYWTENYDLNIFVEWKHDRDTLLIAWERLYPDKDFPYKIIISYWFRTLISSFKDTSSWIFTNSDCKINIWLLDYDTAFKEWKNLKNNDWWEIFEDSDQKWKISKHNSNSLFIMYLPVPSFRDEYIDKEKGENSMLSMELMFPDYIIKKFCNKEKINEEQNSKELFKIKDEKKSKFVESLRSLDKDEFLEFEKIFDAIKNIKIKFS